MLAIHNNPVEAGPSDNFRGYVTAQSAPQSNLPLADEQGVLKVVADASLRPVGLAQVRQVGLPVRRLPQKFLVANRSRSI